MKNNKGFTLVEILATIAILLIIMVIITPKVFKQLKTSEDVTDQEQINSIINISKIYMNQNSNLLPQQNDLYVISLNELKESGLIKTNEILNPSTKQELTGCVIVFYDNNKYNYEYNEDKCDNDIITVTFDAQGGQLKEATKKVLYHNTYGELPTPTKEGYTFLGWNGKNIINMTKFMNSFATATNGYITKKNDSIVLTATYNDSYTNSWGTFDPNAYRINIKKNTTYTFSWNSDLDSNGYEYVFLDGKSSSGNYYYINNNSSKSLTFSTKADTQYINIRLGVEKASNSIEYSNLQIEEGSTATEYEPYYITSDTTVVQGTNHTLKAIWKANS